MTGDEWADTMPAPRHDLRCALWVYSDPDKQCTCGADEETGWPRAGWAADQQHADERGGAA